VELPAHVSAHRPKQCVKCSCARRANNVIARIDVLLSRIDDFRAPEKLASVRPIAKRPRVLRRRVNVCFMHGFNHAKICFALLLIKTIVEFRSICEDVIDGAFQLRAQAEPSDQRRHPVHFMCPR
jgi:hypothetical protein